MEASSEILVLGDLLEIDSILQVTEGHFNPVTHGLHANFRLTNFTGWGCKVPQETLNKLLEELDQEDSVKEHSMRMPIPRFDIGIDCSITPLRQDGLSVVQTTDFVYPLCDDPFIMGRIACANVLSDLYAVGITECDNMLMLLGISNRMSEEERDVVIPLIIKGFKNCALEAGTLITGGETVLNPWLTIGGVATSVCTRNEFIEPNNAVVGDVLVLTKPLGTHIAITAYQLRNFPRNWKGLQVGGRESAIEKAYRRAIDSMSRLNKIPSLLMQSYDAHAATDITGYGLIGHAQNLARIQKNEVSFLIYNLPVIARIEEIADNLNMRQQLVKGHSFETSGGLLICMPREKAVSYCSSVHKHDGMRAFIIGSVEVGDRTARLTNLPSIIQVPSVSKLGQLW